jgi:GNAT superfamily N-acetyltransferase
MDRVELLGLESIPTLTAHLVRNALESGRDGEPLSRAKSADDPPDPDATANRLATAWRIPKLRPCWEVCFGLWIDGTLRGHLDLRGGSIESDLHRADLGMGIERGYRRRGWGRTLMQTAVEWARAQGLAWIDLGVFTENAPAHGLYVAMGFVEVGVIRDRFRIDGREVHDRLMTLRL